MGFHSYRGDFLKGYDRYSKAVSLTYLKSGSYRTGAGGICSIIGFILITWFVGVNVWDTLKPVGSNSVSRKSALI